MIEQVRRQHGGAQQGEQDSNRTNREIQPDKGTVPFHGLEKQAGRERHRTDDFRQSAQQFFILLRHTRQAPAGPVGVLSDLREQFMGSEVVHQTEIHGQQFGKILLGLRIGSGFFLRGVPSFTDTGEQQHGCTHAQQQNREHYQPLGIAVSGDLFQQSDRKHQRYIRRCRFQHRTGCYGNQQAARHFTPELQGAVIDGDGLFQRYPVTLLHAAPPPLCNTCFALQTGGHRNHPGQSVPRGCPPP